MRSPVADCEMQPIEYEGCVIWTCPVSGGELVTPEAMEHIVNTRERRFGHEWDELVANHHPLPIQPSENEPRSLTCPCCGSPMRVVNYAEDSGVFVDRCAGCGAIWLDADELEEIQVLMQRWEDEAPDQIRAISGELREARERAQRECRLPFNPSRLSFVNALMHRLLDAA